MTGTSTAFSAQGFALLLALSFFFGLAYEGFYGDRAPGRPGGVRTFPLLALAGAALYLIEPAHGLAFTAGLLVLGAWLHAFYQRRLQIEAREDAPRGAGLMAPACNLIAYLLGPLALIAPTWAAIGVTVSAVLFLGAKERLHRLAERVPFPELITLGKFLVLTGIVLPLLPREPFTELTPITPYQTWLAVVAVASLSYMSYLVQRYVSHGHGVLLASVLGGIYSSTATTVVLARRARGQNTPGAGIQAGLVLATALMYVRLGVVIAFFDTSLARTLAPALGVLFALGAGIAGLYYRRHNAATEQEQDLEPPENPLELTAALIFAAMFLLISLASAWVQSRFGTGGLYALAALVGVADIDPFVLSLAQGGIAEAEDTVLAVAVLIAASCNNLIKALYTGAFAGVRASLFPAAALASLAAAGLGIAAWIATA